MVRTRFPAVPALLTLVVALQAVVACGTSGEQVVPQLVSEQDAVDDGLEFSMAAAVLRDMGLPEGAVVLVPTDRAVLAQDADALATVARDGGLQRLLERMLVVTEIDPDSLQPGQVAIADGTVLDIEFVDGDLHVGGVRSSGLAEFAGLQLILIDGMIEET